MDQFQLRVRAVEVGDETVVTGAVRSGRVAIGHLVDVVFGRAITPAPVLGLVTSSGGVTEVGPEDGVVRVLLPALDRQRIGPGALLATPETARASAAAELVVQILGELPLRVEVSAWELERRLAGREEAAVGAAIAEAALEAERARPDPDPERFWDTVLRAVAERAPALEAEARAVRFDVNSLATSVYLRALAGQSVYLEVEGTVVRGRSNDRLRPPEHPGAVLKAAVSLTPPIVFTGDPLPVLGASGAGWAHFRVGYALVRASSPVLPVDDERGPLVPFADRAAYLQSCGLSPGFVEVFVRGSFLSFDVGAVEDADRADLHPSLEGPWCALTWWPSGAWLVREGPVFARLDARGALTDEGKDEERVFREVVVAGVLREIEATGWFDEEPEELLELERSDLVTADGTEPPTPIRTRRLHLGERVRDAIRRLDLPYGDHLLDPAWAMDPR